MGVKHRYPAKHHLIDGVYTYAEAEQEAGDGQCGDYSPERLQRMNTRFVAAVQGAFASGRESLAAAAASYTMSIARQAIA
jgi:hypothetical protein